MCGFLLRQCSVNYIYLRTSQKKQINDTNDNS